VAWALLGPSVVLLIQIETLFVIADAFGAIPLRAGVSRWTVGTAVALFFLVCVAQLAAFLWRANRDRREKRLDDRMEMEARLARELDKPSIQPEGNPSPGLLVTERSVDALERFVRDEKQARRIIARFGLEPTWAYQALNELGAPDAVRITRQAKLADARSAGGMITPPLGGLLIIAFILSLFLPGSRSATTVTVLLGVVAAVVPLLGWWGMLAWSKPAIKRNE
jgi:hypothetical protein